MSCHVFVVEPKAAVEMIRDLSIALRIADSLIVHLHVHVLS